MIGYASKTGTRRNLTALKAAGWRLLMGPPWASGAVPTGFEYAMDNGAWHHYQRGTPFDGSAFGAALEALGPGADWVSVPDVVCGGLASLELSRRWLPEVLNRTRLALVPVQDGMTPADVADLVGPRVGIFLGGSTEGDNWKERTCQQWGDFCRSRGVYFHVGRVNSMRRISICAAAGAHSFDGTSASRFAVTLPKLDRARRQRALFHRDDTW